jgi:hypothetical protein
MRTKEEQEEESEGKEGKASWQRSEGAPMTINAWIKQPLALAFTLALAILAFAAASAQAETAGPGWAITSTTYPTDLKPAGKGAILVQPLNVGAAPSSGQVTIEDELPSGVVATAAGGGRVVGGGSTGSAPESVIEPGTWECVIAPGSEANSIVTCKSNQEGLPAIPGGAGPAAANAGGLSTPQPAFVIAVEVPLGAAEGVEANRMTISGGGGETVHAADPLAIGSGAAQFGLARWDGWFSNRDGTPDTQAGSVPYSFTASFDLNTLIEEGSLELFNAGAEARDYAVDLPPGFIGDPQAVPRCTRPQLEHAECPADSAVGIIVPPTRAAIDFSFGVFNMVPPPGEPAQIAFTIANQNFNVYFDPALRTGADYGITTNVNNTPERATIAATLTLWGVPEDPSHNAWRCENGSACGHESEALRTGSLGPHPDLEPFLRMPTSCGSPDPFSIAANSWLDPTEAFTEPLNFFTHDAEGDPVGLTGCNKLPFEPTIASKPTSNVADSPTGLEFDLHIPQPEAVVAEEGEVDEVQALQIDANSGQFKLGFDGHSTIDLPVGALSGAVQAALAALPGIGSGNVSVARPDSSPYLYIVTFEGSLTGTNVEQLAVESGAEPPPTGSLEVSTITNGSSELQTTGAEPAVHEADLKDATIAFPSGLVVDPSEADGLQACSEAQVGFTGFAELNKTTEPGVQTPQFTPGAAECPDASKLGTVEVDTPLLGHPLPGALYLARQGENPFGSLLAVYVTVDDPISGVVVKLPGKVEVDPVSGRVSTIVDQNPQLPFEDFKISLFDGSRAPFTTPSTCGSYSTSSALTPWSSPEGASVSPSGSFEITEGAGGGACPATPAQKPNAPSFSGGTFTPIAGTYSPFVLHLGREDGSQTLSALGVTLPEGLLGKIAGVEKCPQADIEAAERRNGLGQGVLEQSSPSCPSGSELGTAHVGVGSGAPFYVTGHAYLAGPYAGAPFSVVVVTPAVAGPFDLGTVVVRSALFIDPTTAQVTVKSDPFPTILDGIPLDIRAITVEITRSQFTLNPTSCEAMSVTGTIASTQSQSASVSSPFKVGGCGNLPFHPSFAVSTNGKTSKAGGASLTVNITSKPGEEANLRKVDVQVPSQLPARLTTLQKACTEAQFSANPAGCPAASDVATATVRTPLLNVPLSGPVYFVSHGGAAFPDLEIVLQGEGVTIVLTGNTNIKGNITTSKFEAAPDAPFESFELNAPQGPDSILAVNLPQSADYSLCGQSLTMPTTLVGQNGAVFKQETKMAVTGCPKTAVKTLTRAQKLAKALEECRHKYKARKKRHKRETCEKQAKKRYGPVKKSKKHKTKKK